jgi:hypothetical protein
MDEPGVGTVTTSHKVIIINPSLITIIRVSKLRNNDYETNEVHMEVQSLGSEKTASSLKSIDQPFPLAG